MPRADFFKRFGLFAQERFFEPEWCRKTRLEMDRGTESLATVGNKEGTLEVDTSIRSCKHCGVKPESLSFAQQRLQALKPVLEKHFGVNLKGFQPLQFLKYEPGDFYRPHYDRRDDERAMDTSRERLVTAVTFLNDQTEEPAPESYVGGALTVYGLLDDPRMLRCGFPLIPEAGLVVSFRADQLHEVNPVTDGNRYTMVAFFN